MSKKKEAATVAAAEAVIAAVKKKLGVRIGMSSDSRSLAVEVIPTGISVLDNYLLGCGGLPVGRISEVYSEEGGGKTSFALHCLGRTQKIGTGLAMLADDEESLSEERARVFGVNPKDLILIPGGHMEQSLDAQYTAVASIPKGVGPNLLVWDSLFASPPLCELRGDAGDQSMAERARILGRTVPKMLKLLNAKRCHWLVINQTRQKMGVVFGDATTTPGGKVVKFLASTRVQLFTGKSLKDSAGQHVGKTVTFLGVKNRFAPPYRKARVRLLFADGFEEKWAVVDHAKNLGAIPKGLKVAEGYDRAMAFFTEHGWDHVRADAEKSVTGADDIEEEKDDGLEG